MASPIISVENLSKRYTLRHQKAGYSTLRDALAEKARRMVGKNADESAAATEEFWALKDVSFDISQGDVVGIIGRNGAGKSTLLKILSRITEPTKGKIRLRGRVASLLEVGTGFHPELTGRENIFLNGAILGMTKAEIRAKFDEIVAFAEVDRFLDTPVKHYSSGMYVRLAFAVAAHLEPEILIVDEVLAVGDAHFQKKCLGKMSQVAGAGRTVLFVSHNLAVVQSICRDVALLTGGRLSFFGPTEIGVSQYWKQSHTTDSADLTTISHRTGTGQVRFTRLAYTGVSGERMASPVCGLPLRIELHYESISKNTLRGCRASISFCNSSGAPLLWYSTELTNPELASLEPRGRLICDIPRFPLTAGTYALSLFFSSGQTIHDWIDSAISCVVQDGDFFGAGAAINPGWQGKCVLSPHSWFNCAQNTVDQSPAWQQTAS